MDVRVYIPEEAALVTLALVADESGELRLPEESLSGFRLHAAANGLYEFVALRG